ncbi:MAG: helix-turn-helix domain-containing protein [Candidatus Nanohalobium sp.]
MALSIADIIEKEDIECEDLLECITGSGELDKEIYFKVLEKGAMDLDEMAEQVDRERSTIYRAVQRLEENGFLNKEKVGREGGGYRHIYEPVDPDKVADEMLNRLNEWYSDMGQMIHEFKEKYPKEQY